MPLISFDTPWRHQGVSKEISGMKWVNLLAGITLFKLFKVNNGNTKTVCKICSKLTIKKRERPYNAVMLFLWLTLNKFHLMFCCFHCWLWTNNCHLGCSNDCKILETTVIKGNICMKWRDVFRIELNIYDEAELIIFTKKLHRRFSTGFYKSLWNVVKGIC